MDKRLVRVLASLILLAFLALSPAAARAQNQLEVTFIAVGAPLQPKLGEPLTVQAVLADSQGRPISGATIYFTTQARFLSRSDDVVLAQAVTNLNGQAVSQFIDNEAGTLALTAEYRGDARYAASNATIQVAAAGEQQLYVEHIGVDVPAISLLPMTAQVSYLQSPFRSISRFADSLWPATTGWPLLIVLLLVWSMYLLAVRFVWRLAALGSQPDDAPSLDSGRPS